MIMDYCDNCGRWANVEIVHSVLMCSPCEASEYLADHVAMIMVSWSHDEGVIV